MSIAHLYLAIAIVCEVTATTALKQSESFSRLVPSLITAAGYGASFWFLSLTLRTMSTGVVYAIWSGIGIVLISIVSWIWFKQNLDLPAMLGMGLIIAGVLTINLFSKSVGH
jgi:small multidrug resistance pump